MHNYHSGKIFRGGGGAPSYVQLKIKRGLSLLIYSYRGVHANITYVSLILLRSYFCH